MKYPNENEVIKQFAERVKSLRNEKQNSLEEYGHLLLQKLSRTTQHKIKRKLT